MSPQGGGDPLGVRAHQPRVGVGPAPRLAEALAEELDDLDVPWQETVRVALDDTGAVVGTVLLDWDDETSRSWVHGPWTRDEAAWDAAAEALLDAAIEQTPTAIEDHEVSAAPAHERMSALVASRGWTASEVTIVYVARSADGWPDPPPTVRAATEDDLDAVTAIHDLAFPGTYATARRLLTDPERITVVLADTRDGAPVLGYASAEIHADGEGYLDFIALAPQARGQGRGAGLLGAIGRAGLAAAPAGSLALTVGESNAPAVALYERFGFVREAELVGYRTRARD